METNSTLLKKAIMRRVWYSYIISILFSFFTFLGFVFGASSVLFLKSVSLTNIFNNLLHVQLGTVPTYIWQTFSQAFSQGEFITLISLGLIVCSLILLKVLMHIPMRREVQFG